MPAGKRPTKRDAQAAVAARLGNYQAKVPKRTALVGHSDGSTIDVTGKPDYVYARIRGDDRAQLEVLNYHGALAYNMPVKMELVTLDNEKKMWAITGIDRSFFVDTGGWGGAGNVGSHRESHEWPDQAPGPDAINVYARAIAPLRGYSIAGAGLRVYVNSAILTAYVGNGVYIYTGGSVLIASGDLPTTAGQIRIILISLDISDPDNPSLTKTLGDPVLALESIEPEEPDFPADEIPVCAVLVRDDHTQLEEIDIYDRRKLVTGNVKLSALTSPDGTLTPLSVDNNGDVTAYGDILAGDTERGRILAAIPTDLILLDSANISGISSHFLDNDASYPAGWTETDAAWNVNTNDPYSYFNITSHPTDTTFDYRIQGSWDLENDSAANAFNSWILGPMNYRPDDAWSGDTEFYFGIYRDNAGSIDTGTYVRVLLQFNNAGTIWRVRGEVRDGTTQTAGSWFTVPFPYTQPIYLRVVLRNDTNKNGRNYIGTGLACDPLSQYRVQLQNVGNTVTWGTVWARIHGSQPAGGANATWKLGALDFVSSASIG